MTPPLELSELQLAVMRVLWERQKAAVAEVQEALAPERDLALTTVATVVRASPRSGSSASCTSATAAFLRCHSTRITASCSSLRSRSGVMG